MLHRLFFLASVFIPFQMTGQDVPENLIKSANEIIISDLTLFKILAIDHSELHQKYLTRIQNKYADHGNTISLYYNDFRSIESANVTVYDNNFKKIDQFKLKDFEDISVKGGSIADDNRIKYLKVKSPRYPYYVEAEYTIRFKGSMHYPKWIPQSGEKISIISSELIVESFLQQPFRYHANIPTADSLIEENHHQYVWRADSLPGFSFEKFSYDISHYSPVVQLAPNQFQMDGMEGNMSSWQTFGDWIYTLGKGRNTMTEDQVREIRELVKNMDEINKIKTVYKYLQDNTRYVSIQLGIGGWQPFESKFVHENKYGDCKALSFYTQSLLKALDIPSYYTIIRAGSSQQQVPVDFPNAHFNHAILTVPLQKDTIWLECTSQTSPFGYMGTFTSDREALIVKPDGASQLIHTKKYTLNDNLQQTLIHQNIFKDGSSQCQVTRTFRGLEIENDGFRGIVKESAKKQSEWFLDNHPWGNLRIDSLYVSEISNEPVPEAYFNVNIQLDKAGNFMGKRLFYQPLMFTNIDYIKLSKKDRVVPLEIRFPYTQQDSIQVTFDEAYYIEKPMGNIELSSIYGNYSRTVIQNENSFTITRKFQINEGNYDASEYTLFKEFIEEVQKNDREKLVMVNKT